MFPEEDFKKPNFDVQTDDAECNECEYTSAKIFKIKYSINLLMQSTFYMKYDRETSQYHKHNSETSLMAICVDSDELEIFNSKALQ